MAWKVEFLDRSGKKTTSPAFGDQGLAERYARTVRGSKVVPVDVDAPPPVVQACPPAEVVQAQRQRDSEAAFIERQAEAAHEAGTQARLMGASSSEALDAAWAARNQVRFPDDGQAVEQVQTCSGGCGRIVTRGFTMSEVF
jgi:hypothetical protein